MNLQKTKVVFADGNNFLIFHNMPDEGFKTLFKEWRETSTSKNPKSLAEYIRAIGYAGYTEKQYKRQGILSRKIK